MTDKPSDYPCTQCGGECEETDGTEYEWEQGQAHTTCTSCGHVEPLY